MLTLFANSVTIRGFLGADAEAPSSDHIQNDSFAILQLVTVSGVWDLGHNQWNPRTDWHRIICPGAYFCGLTRGMWRGDYLEVEGELREFVEKFTFVEDGNTHHARRQRYAVYAIRITRLDRPDALVDFGEDG
jgi:hypothetical protein